MEPEKENVTLVELKELYETSEKLAREIRMLSRSFKKLAASGLKVETIVLLLHASSGVGKTDIRTLLGAINTLERDYVNPTD